jgi:RecA-family ATPase
MSELVADIDRMRPVLVVLDASADLFGGDEIKRAEVRSFIAILRSSIAIPYKCCVLLLTHPSVSGMERGSGYSGSTAWNNSARSRLYFDQSHKDDPESRVLELQKNNRGKTGEKIQLRWDSSGYYIVQSPAAAHDAAKAAKAKQVFLDLLRRYEDQGRVVSDKQATNLAPTRFAEEPEAQAADLKKSDLEKAMLALFAEKRIEVVTEGKGSHARSKIVEAGGAL